uniref:Aldehyde oxidase-like n=1 Tax=Stegastes partitus TaxID=144197 RepID=A0A3B4Z5M9_9TELE
MNFYLVSCPVGLTGTKYGCGGGGCGSCTVMVSRYDRNQERVVHYTVNACLQPVVALHGAAVVTVEGVGSTDTKLHPVQERIAKAHGSQCGFCTPGMVMSMYTLLRNKPQPSMEDIREALGGNLCRCTGYRPIIDGFKTFCESSGCCQNGGEGRCCMETEGSKISQELFPMEDLLPLDPSQDLIFPPELMMMEKKLSAAPLYFQGERVRLVAPFELSHLLELKADHPSAPLIVGNTTIGPKMLLKGEFHPLVIYAGRISELGAVTWGKNGLTVGAACSLSTLKEEVEKAVAEMEEAKTRGYRALLQVLQCLAGKQIRNMASIGGNLLSANPKYDLSTVLAALDCTLHVISKDKMRSLPLDEKLFPDFGKTTLRPDEVLLAVDIPYTNSWEFVAAYRQAQRREFAFSFVNAGMKAVIREGTDTVESLSVYYGGVGPAVVKPKRTCQQLVGWSWREDFLSEACRLLNEDIDVSPAIHGGKAEYRKALAVSFFFKFYMQVVLEMRERGVSNVALPPEYLSALKPFKNEAPQGQQSFQLVSEVQPCGDPVGRPSMHQSALQQATGEAKYYDDLPPVQGELFVFMVTSSRAHARIINIDPSEALNQPGVVAFVSAGDVPGANRRLWFNNPEELFAEEEVLCVGQIVGAVVAESREQARRAAQKVRVTYRDLQPVFFTIEDAIKHESFFEPKRKVERGDVDEALKTAEHILEDQLYMGGQEHFYLETQGVIAAPKGEHQEMDLFVASQHAAFTQEVVAMALGVDSNKITCHVKRLGGAFGGKVMKIASLSAIAAVAARKTGRAVRCCLERGDDMLITSGRHPFLGKYKSGRGGSSLSKAAQTSRSAHTSSSCSGGTPRRSQDACEKLMRRLQPLMEKNPKNSWKQTITEAYFQKISLSATGFFMGPPTDVDWEKGQGQAYYYFTFGACCSEVEIDCLTGDHKNIRTDIVMDVGKSINPALDVGQVEGSFVQGVGLYTIEELQFSADGVLMTRGPTQYKIPPLCDVPAELNVHLLADAGNPNAIYLSKGIGEPPVFFGCTIFFAIKAAIAAARQETGLSDVFPLSSPATAEKIRMACQDQFTKMVRAK